MLVVLMCVDFIFISRTDWKRESIKELAQARAKQRAAQWAAANQISLTLAGEEGAMQQSLVKGGGWQRFEGQLRTESQIFENNVVGPLSPLFSWSLWKGIGETIGLGGSSLNGDPDYNILEANCAYYYPDENHFRPCTNTEMEDKKKCEEGSEEEKKGIRCDRLRSIEGTQSASLQFKILEMEQKQHQNARESANLAFRYSLSLNSVSENNIKSLDETLSLINGQIKRSIETMGAGSGPGLISVRNN